MTSARDAYDALIDYGKKTSLLGSCAAVLGWEKETYMPPGGAGHRAEQLTLLAGMTHERATSPRVGEWLDTVEGSDVVTDPLSVESVNIREMRRSYEKATKLPQRLVEEIARTGALGHEAWVQARKESDFQTFRPWLEKMVGLKREQAEALGYEDHIYDALLDGYEPDETTANVTKVFDELREDLEPLVQEIASAPKQPDRSILTRHYPVDRQKMFGEMAAAAAGFDFRRGRLDEVVHPFCSTFGPGDTRITTRYNPNFFNECFFGVMHETGHGLYGQGLVEEHYGTPMGRPVSLSIHESQSRMWENFVGRSPAFWEHFYPKAQGVFHEALAGTGEAAFIHAINDVRPSFIRVEADEATYNLHIVLRFELEQALISGDLPPADVPGAWNEKFKGLLGLDVPDDARGCLQDTHWSGGGIGYFPTYALGNLYAAQLFARAEQDIPGLVDGFRHGDFGALLDWLREKIHAHGMRYRSNDLVKEITGEPLSHKHLIAHLRAKYGRLYGLA